MKLMISPEVTIPSSFFVPGSVTGSRRNPQPVIMMTEVIMLCVGGMDTTSRVASAHHLAFVLYNMGLELNRPPVEFAPHF